MITIEMSPLVLGRLIYSKGDRKANLRQAKIEEREVPTVALAAVKQPLHLS